MRPFAYERPTSLAGAISLLAQHGPDARLLAGGTDLIIRLRDGTIQPRLVVDVKNIAELDGEIREADGYLRIGATTVMTDIAADERIRRDHQALAEAAAVVGAVQIRNRATLAGNICNASPAADTTPALLVDEARVVATGPSGSRRIPIDAFFVRSGVTTLAAGRARHRDRAAAAGDAARDGPRPADTPARPRSRLGHPGLRGRSGRVTRIAYGSLGPRPLLVVDASGLLADPSASDDAKRERLAALFVDASPSPTSMRSGPEYRLAMLHVLGLRAVHTAIERLAAA